MIAESIQGWSREKVLLVFLLLVGVVGGVLAFTPSYFSNTNVLIGLCLFPFTLLVTGPRRNNYCYIIAIVLFAVLAVTYGVRIFYFFCLAFYLLWIIELFLGRLNILILFLIVFMSPFFIQVVTILGFPLRLMLSGYAGEILKLIGVDVQVNGNMMILDGAMFSVDEACMGLSMLAISLLMGVFVLAFHHRLSNKTLGLYSAGLFFAGALILNMVANVVRIVALVYFRIPAEDPMHEVIGILCLIVYVVIPLQFLGKWLVRKYGTPKIDSASAVAITRRNFFVVAVIPILVLFVGATIESNRQSSAVAHANVHFGNAKPELLRDGITKISTSNLLIYVKTIPEFFTGEHTPLMCWKGSGYEFTGIATTTVAGITIYKGILVNGGKTLHTAWWYSNGRVETISQVDWRMRMLKGEPRFCLVNVTAEEERTLMDAIDSMLRTSPLIAKH